MAAISGVGQPMAVPQTAGHHTALGAYCTSLSRLDHHMTPGHIAGRVIAAARDQMRRNWLLVGSDFRLMAGLLSHWLRGRQPSITQEHFQQRWCHEASEACQRTWKSQSTFTGQRRTQCRYEPVHFLTPCYPLCGRDILIIVALLPKDLPVPCLVCISPHDSYLTARAETAIPMHTSPSLCRLASGASP